jgi:hypothetical protein
MHGAPKTPRAEQRHPSFSMFCDNQLDMRSIGTCISSYRESPIRHIVDCGSWFWSTTTKQWFLICTDTIREESHNKRTKGARAFSYALASISKVISYGSTLSRSSRGSSRIIRQVCLPHHDPTTVSLGLAVCSEELGVVLARWTFLGWACASRFQVSNKNSMLW